MKKGGNGARRRKKGGGDIGGLTPHARNSVRQWAEEAAQEVVLARMGAAESGPDALRVRTSWCQDAREAVLCATRVRYDMVEAATPWLLSLGEKTVGEFRRHVRASLAESEKDGGARGTPVVVDVRILTGRKKLDLNERDNFDVAGGHELVVVPGEKGARAVHSLGLADAVRQSSSSATLLAIMYNHLLGQNAFSRKELEGIRVYRFNRSDATLTLKEYAKLLDERPDETAVVLQRPAAHELVAAARPGAFNLKPKKRPEKRPAPLPPAEDPDTEDGVVVKKAVATTPGWRGFLRRYAVAIGIIAALLLMGYISFQADVFDMDYEDFMDNYDILGLPKDAPFEDVKRTFRLLSRKLHPDKCRDDCEDVESRFQKVSQAYQMIADYHSGRVRLLKDSVRKRHTAEKGEPTKSESPSSAA